jgi:hypothetical protein
MARHTWRYFNYHARCDECGWELFAKNALGCAAKHHDKTGHTVVVDIDGQVTYCEEAAHAEKVSIRGHMRRKK